MIKLLRKKFIVSSMLAITLLIIVLLGAVNIFNAVYLSQQTNTLLDTLVDEKKPDAPQKNNLPDDKNSQPTIIHSKIPTEDKKQSALYFTIETDEQNNITSVDVEHIPSIDESYAKEIYSKISDSEGKINSFRYKTIHIPNGGTKTIFLSTSDEWGTVLRVALLSVSIGIVCWGLMLMLILLLAKKAIAPIAKNIEKQKQFITDAGHEIKTPLAIIMANTEAMELHNGESKWSKNIKTQTTRLTGLMQNLLSLARIESGEQNLQSQKINLSEIVTETIQTFEESARLRNLKIVSNTEDEITVEAEKEKIITLVSILLDNAVKYAEEGTTINVELFNGKKTSLRVINECRNLPDCKAETLFDRFYRGDTARNQKSGGYGIGLSSAKAIAELFHGEINAEYIGENRIKFEFII